jgi:hypothetical protein
MNHRTWAVLLLGGAWMLWSHSISVRPDFDVWHLDRVMPTQEACQGEKQRIHQAYVQEARRYGAASSAKDTVYLTKGEQTIVLGWYCYPDTIDPRAPKP